MTRASADTAADATATIPSFTAVSTITIAESGNGVFAQTGTTTRSLSLCHPFEFDLGSSDPSVTNNVGASDITTPVINRVDSNNITVVFTTDDVRDSLDTLTITGIRVQPISGWGPVTNYFDMNFDNKTFDGFYALMRKKKSLAPAITQGVLVWSFGPDGKVDSDWNTGMDAAGKGKGANKDNILSWE